jgi:trehalose 6-phosphate synthase
VADTELIIASNRGPVSFIRDQTGGVVATRGGGGLVTALIGALQAAGGLWVAAAMSDEDREQAMAGRLPAEGYDLRYLVFDRDAYDRYYNGISNRVLWFLHHCLWDIPRAPVFDRRTQEDWRAYRDINLAFAEALDAESAGQDPAFLVQDYHLALVPAMLRERQPRARIAHFSHIPFAGPMYFRILPQDIRGELLTGLLGADVVGFHSDAWAESFLATCRSVLGARVNLGRRVIRWRGREVRVRVYPISIDVDELLAVAGSAEVARARRWVTRWRGEARLILRVDRTELAKNILRGFLAYETFLDQRAEWRGRVRMLALLNPSRGEVTEYHTYLDECLAEADRINARFRQGDWSPIEVLVGDDFPRAVAAYGQYDVLLVNPVFDGMNLVAKEGPVLNRAGGVLVLSRNAGAFQELGRYALPVNPFDVGETADAIAAALEMGKEERRRRARGLRRAVQRTRLADWVAAQINDLRRPEPVTSQGRQQIEEP